jgi:tetratricopeptide (TPR) repeat protein
MAERRFDTEAALRHLDEAVRGLSDPVRRGETAVEYGRCLLRANRHDDAIAVFEDAFERLGEERSDLRDLLEAELIGAAWWVPRQLPRAVERLAGVCEDELRGGSGAAVMLTSIGYHEARVGGSRSRSEELIERGLAGGHLQQDGGRALYYAGYAITIAGRPEEALRTYELALASARQRGDLVTVAGVLLFRSLVALYLGDVPAADEDLRESRALGGFQMMRPYQAAFMAQVLMDRGQHAEAEEALAAAGLPDELPVNAHLCFFRQARQRLLREQGRAEDAVADAESLCRNMQALQILNPAYMPWRSDAALALQLAGRTDEACALAAEELELARGWGTARPIGIALRTLGLLEGGRDGERLLEEAVEALAASPARLEHARALLELGAARRARNERASARDALRQAAELALRCGAAAVAEAAQRELAATGAARAGSSSRVSRRSRRASDGSPRWRREA